VYIGHRKTSLTPPLEKNIGFILPLYGREWKQTLPQRVYRRGIWGETQMPQDDVMGNCIKLIGKPCSDLIMHFNKLI
jgi:hypothetical protein